MAKKQPKWSVAQHKKYAATLARKKAATTTVGRAAVDSALSTEAQEARVDVRRIEQYNYRRGLMTALDVIMRELRDAY